jgi:hypothetical protein
MQLGQLHAVRPITSLHRAAHLHPPWSRTGIFLCRNDIWTLVPVARWSLTNGTLMSESSPRNELRPKRTNPVQPVAPLSAGSPCAGYKVPGYLRPSPSCLPSWETRWHHRGQQELREPAAMPLSLPWSPRPDLAMTGPLLLWGDRGDSSGHGDAVHGVRVVNVRLGLRRLLIGDWRPPRNRTPPWSGVSVPKSLVWTSLCFSRWPTPRLALGRVEFRAPAIARGGGRPWHHRARRRAAAGALSELKKGGRGTLGPSDHYWMVPIWSCVPVD